METEAILEEAIKKEQRYYYAQIDTNGICVSISDLAGEVDSPDMIPLNVNTDLSEYYNLLGQKYNELSKVFEKTEEQIIGETRPLSQEQEVLYNIQSNLEYLVCLSEVQGE